MADTPKATVPPAGPPKDQTLSEGGVCPDLEGSDVGLLAAYGFCLAPRRVGGFLASCDLPKTDDRVGHGTLNKSIHGVPAVCPALSLARGTQQ